MNNNLRRFKKYVSALLSVVMLFGIVTISPAMEVMAAEASNKTIIAHVVSIGGELVRFELKELAKDNITGSEKKLIALYNSRDLDPNDEFDDGIIAYVFAEQDSTGNLTPDGAEFYVDAGAVMGTYLDIIKDSSKTLAEAIEAVYAVDIPSAVTKGKQIYVPEKDSSGNYQISEEYAHIVDDEGYNTSVDSEVCEVSIKSLPEKIVYTEGENLDLTGLVVTLIKSDNTKEDVGIDSFINKGLTTNPENGTILSAVDTEVTIIHNSSGQKVVQPITVNAAPITVVGVAIVDGEDGFSEITIPSVGQILRANILLSDGTTIFTYPVDADATYKWYYMDSDQVIGTDSSYTVTADNIGKIICIDVTMGSKYEGEAAWMAKGAVELIEVSRVSVVDGIDGFTEVAVPAVGQVLRANIILTNGTVIYSYPEDPKATYTWFYKENKQVIGTGSSFTVTADNGGKTICVDVTMGDKYSGTATWEAMGAVASVTVKGVSVVDGKDGFTQVSTPYVGQILRANILLSDGSTVYSYPGDTQATYRWYYLENNQVIGTESSFTVTADNGGKTICVRVTMGSKFSGAATWEALNAVTPVAVIGVAVVDGKDGFTEITTPNAGQILRANILLSDGTTVYTYPGDTNATYKWYYKENDQIIGTDSSYTVTADNAGHIICVEVTMGEKYSGVASWEASAAIDSITVTGVSVVNGLDGISPVTELYVGQILHANILLSDGSVVYTHPENSNATYTWYYKENDQVIGKESTYTVTTDNIGKTIAVAVTMGIKYEGEAKWAANSAAELIEVSGVSVVDGADGITLVTEPYLGQILRANILLTNGTIIYTYPGDIYATYSWYYKENGQVIGTASSYTVNVENNGKTICVDVSMGKKYAGTVTWTASKIVAPVIVKGVSVVDGSDGVSEVIMPVVGQVLHANILLSDGTTVYTYPGDINATYKWYYRENDQVIGTDSTYTVTADNGGKTIGVRVTMGSKFSGGAIWEAIRVVPSVTVVGAAVVDGLDETTPISEPYVSQVLLANILLSDGSTVYTKPGDTFATYKWYYKETDQVIGTDPSFTVTSDNGGKTICVEVTMSSKYEGKAVWTASAVVESIEVISVSVVDGSDGMTAVTEPYIGQILRANINLSNGAAIYTYPVDPNATYKWYYKGTDQIVGVDSSYTVTADIGGNILCVEVTMGNKYPGIAKWEASKAITVSQVIVVDGSDGVTPVTTPYVGQVLRANILLSDGTMIYTYPGDPNATYKWYYFRTDHVIGIDSSYTVTADNIDEIICVEVTMSNKFSGLVTWTASGFVTK